MTAAHEFGHAILHGKQIAAAGRGTVHPSLYRKKKEIPPFRDPERQASVFAGRLLVPTGSLWRAISSPIGLNIRDLSDAFQVSELAMSVRLSEIGAF
jgi:Zn-dependent peptidase ImmA (M78 family)